MTSAVIAFLDVGQGDCTVVADLEAKEALLIDCPSRGIELAYRVIGELGVQATTAIVSHTDLDHVGGVPVLVRRLGIRRVYFNYDRAFRPKERPSHWESAFTELKGLEDEGVSLEPASTHAPASLGSSTYEIIWPTYGEVGMAAMARKPNRASAIVRLEVGGTIGLVSGDADAYAWKRVLDKRRSDVSCDVFRLPHHGGSLDGKVPGLAAILDATSATHHVISVGTRGGYDHPLPATLSELRSRAPDARILCTQAGRACGALESSASDPTGLLAAQHQGVGIWPNAFPCAGSIWVRVDSGGFRVTPSVPAHSKVIANLPTPQCV